MKRSLAAFRDAASFIAGILAGLAIGVLAFAIIDAFPDEWQAWPVFGASIFLTLGIALQIVATHKPRPRRKTDLELDVLPVKFVHANR